MSGYGGAALYPRHLTAISYGHPRNPKTWSGTPFSVLGALDAAGVDVQPVDLGQIPRLLKGLTAAYHWATCGGSRDFRRSLVYSRISSTARMRRLGDVEHVLHFCTQGLPNAKRWAPEARNYLYLDATIETLSSFGRYQGGEKHRAELLRAQRAAFNATDHFFPVSRYLAEHLHEEHQVAWSAMTVVGTGTGAIRPAPKVEVAGDRLLMVAKVGFDYKGGFEVLRAFDLLRAKRPRLSLTIVAGAWADRIEPRAGLTIHRAVGLEELQRLFEAASLYVMPSRNEPWGLVYLEALSTETPVVGLRRNALPEMLDMGRFGYMLNDSDAHELANIIDKALDDEAGRRRKGREGRASIEQRFTWERVAHLMLEAMGASRPEPPG